MINHEMIEWDRRTRVRREMELGWKGGGEIMGVEMVLGDV